MFDVILSWNMQGIWLMASLTPCKLQQVSAKYIALYKENNEYTDYEDCEGL